MGSVSASLEKGSNVSQPLTAGCSETLGVWVNKIAPALHPLHGKCDFIFQRVVRVTLLMRGKQAELSPVISGAEGSRCGVLGYSGWPERWSLIPSQSGVDRT